MAWLSQCWHMVLSNKNKRDIIAKKTRFAKWFVCFVMVMGCNFCFFKFTLLK
ncbi:hypothetical protein [Moraxella lacunata]|uniref:hypothetical protein n=1 Tax=Moraxella lacunata TaxID=477 RepID=UPI003EE32981